MPITINGTTGISGVDGSAATPALQGSDTNTGISFGADTVNINTGGTTRATVDSSGNVGIGTTPGSMTVTSGLVVNNSTAGNYPGYEIRTANTLRFLINSNDSASYISTYGALPMVLSTNATERMRIHSTGNTSLSGGISLGGLGDPGSYIVFNGSVIGSGAGTYALKWNNTNGRVTYDTSSRLIKEEIVDCPYGIDELKQLQPRKYFRTDDQREEIGFVADEIVSVMPEFVPVGPKSVITRNEDDTEEIPLGVNYDKLTAVLTKALQEAIAKIETLEARLTAAGI